MTFLEVPFREKDQAKSLGARWDAVSKKWYVPADFSGDMAVFGKWLKQEQDLFANPPIDQSEQTEQKGIRLSQALYKVQSVLRQGFAGGIWVLAEIANINTRRGHVYLELTETDESGKVIASCRSMIWQSQASHLLQRFQEVTGSELTIGQKVLLLTEVSFHEQYGFSLVVQDLDPSYTLGELEQQLNKIRKNLIKKGIYQNNKQLKLANDFFRLAVIAPPQAAGLGDFRADADQLQKSGLCDFKYFYSSFQGSEVESEMLAAIDAVHALHQNKAFDALIVIRGGGAKLDLNMLNIESIATALCEAKLPVLSGIGHERDNTILDEVSHTRFDTPSKVIGYVRQQITQQAQIAKANWLEIEQSSRLKVQTLQKVINQFNHEITQNSLANVYRWQQRIEPVNYQIKRLSEQRISSAQHQLSSLYERVSTQIQQQVKLIGADIKQLHESILSGSQRAVEIQKQQVIQSIAFILSSGPKSQLNRGFNIAKDDAGKLITTAKQARKEASLVLEFTDGTVKVDVIE